jgi:hypothetical protein
MNLPTLPRLCGMIAATLAAGVASAATINASSAMPNSTVLTTANQVVIVKHIFGVHYYNNEKFSCGAKMEFSDGTPPKNYTLTQATTPQQVIEEKHYQAPGVFSVTLSGSAWGGYPACLGSQTSTTTITKLAVAGKFSETNTGAPALAPILKIAAPGKVTAVSTPSPTVIPGQNGILVPFTINGVGENCALRLSPHVQLEPDAVFMDVKTFPVTISVNFPNKQEEYVMHVSGAASKIGQPPCQGSVETNLKTRMKLQLAESPQVTGKIGTLTTTYPKMMMAANGLDVPFTADGLGGNCSMLVTAKSASGTKEIKMQVTTFPTTFNIHFDNANADYVIHASGGAATPTMLGCAGDVEKKFSTYVKPPVAPYITGMGMFSLSSLKEDAARQDEAIEFYVKGNINNENDPSQQCGWTLFLVNSNGQGKPITTGKVFSGSQTIAAGKLAGFEPGNYTLHVKSSSLDDGLASVSCGSSADQKFTLLKAVGTIKDVQLKSFGQHFNAGKEHGPNSPGGEPMEGPDFCNNCTSIFSPAHDIGGLRIKPVFIGGQECSYAVIQKFNGKQTTHFVKYTPGNAMAGIGAQAVPGLNVYSDDQTTVEVTLAGVINPYQPNLTPCQGSVTKTIVVHDNPSMPAWTK